MKIAFYTLGCKVNQYESQALKEKFMALGHDIVGEQEFADVYIVNTCTVTGLADRKSRQYIRRMKKRNPESVTAVIGCYAQANPDEVKAIKGVDIITGTNEKNRLPQYIDAFLAEKERLQICHIRKHEDLGSYEETGSITSMESRTRAYIKVQEGCNQFCSYCIIPYARGAVRSRAKEDIVREAENLISKGFKELVLTGINTALYGTEESLSKKPGNCPEDYTKHIAEKEEEPYGIEVIVNLLNALPGDFRIRLGSLEPTVINASYVKRLLRYKKLCHHLHLSLQSGSDRILKRMNRHYSTEGYRQIVEVLRDSDACYGLTTDIIVGFPGETEEDFLESVRMVNETGFNKVHIFPYSKRQGTKAAEMEGQIPANVKKDRSVRLGEAGEKAFLQFLTNCAGSVRQVLFEEYHEDDRTVSGFSDNYIRVYCSVPDGSTADSLLNQFYEVKLLNPYKDGVKGRVEN